MSDTALVLLGKVGDCYNAAPIAKHLHDNSKTPHWVVSINYVPVLRGFSYIEIDPVHFTPVQIDLALEYARNKYANVLNCQPYGKHFTGPKDCAYNEMSWRHVGYGEHFYDTKNFPLIFDRRDAERESFLVTQHVNGGRPLVLLSVGCGKSSPFPTHHAFSGAIKRKFGPHCEIVDLCLVKAARIYDWLGLFDKATLLITTDTAALHLATASPKMKVIALTNDNPFLATSPRCNVVFKTTYSKVTEKMPEIHEAVRQALVASRG